MEDPTATPEPAPLDPKHSWLETGPIVGLTIGVVTTLLVFGGILWGTWSAYRALESASSDQLELRRLTTQITRLDDVLATSARYAAATGESKWEVRHTEALPELRAAITDAAALSLESFSGGAGKVGARADRDRVTAIEVEAFEWVRSGRREEGG